MRIGSAPPNIYYPCGWAHARSLYGYLKGHLLNIIASRRLETLSPQRSRLWPSVLVCYRPVWGLNLYTPGSSIPSCADGTAPKASLLCALIYFPRPYCLASSLNNSVFFCFDLDGWKVVGVPRICLSLGLFRYTAMVRAGKSPSAVYTEHCGYGFGSGNIFGSFGLS